MAEKDSFIVYTDIKETLDDLDDAQVAKLFRGMVDYQLTGKDPKFKGILKYVFIPIRQQMDRNNEKWSDTKEKRAESGRKGGLKSAETRAKQNQANEANAYFASSGEANEAKPSTASTVEANEANQAVNVTVPVTVTDTVTVNGTVTVTDTVGAEMSPDSSLPLRILHYLNEKTGASYEISDVTEERLTDLIDMGYTEKDMISVIDRKCAEWMDDGKMRAFLRPSTLFGPKFSEYLSAPEPYQAEEGRKRSKDKAKVTETLKGLQEEYQKITAQIEREDNPLLLGPLYDQLALCEDRMDAAQKRLEAMA